MTREHANLAGRKTQSMSTNYDCFILATKHSCFLKDEILSHGIPIVDTRNFLPKSKQVVQG
jgi:UDP-N-acetyl-D-glucosamine dehydrogenase